MRRILVVFIVIFAFEGLLAAQSNKLDKALQKQLQKSQTNGNSGPGSSNSGPGNGNARVRVIIQTVGDPDTTGVSELVKKDGRVLHKFRIFPGIAAELPLSAIANAAANSRVRRISLDANVSGSLTLPTDPSVVDVNRLVTGAPQAWSQYGVSGAGIGVGVIDSGVSGTPDVFSKRDVDFTGENSTADAYGHGTHVAGILAGSGAQSGNKYVGAAPMVNIVNLRVLDANGSGYTTNVIRAIEWAIQNRNAVGNDGKPLNLRVLNLSLGHMPHESAETDPLAIACRKAVMAGIVVVAAAGNYGKDEKNHTVFGGITSPGTEPSVITVGAMSTFNTLDRSDDVVASYSSRGPSIDNIIKPDIAAPGTRIIAASAAGNNLARTYPQLVVDSNYLRLSGTSMATPFVSASAAMILQKNPALTPNAVKAVLMYTAERRGGRNALAMGAGYLNTLGAVSLAANINANAAISSYWLLDNGLGLSYFSDISGYRAVWGGTIVWEDALYSGNSLYYNHKAWGSTIVWGDTLVWDELKRVFSGTIVWEDDLFALNEIILGQTIVWEDLISALNGTDIDVEW